MPTCIVGGFKGKRDLNHNSWGGMTHQVAYDRRPLPYDTAKDMIGKYDAAYVMTVHDMHLCHCF